MIGIKNSVDISFLGFGTSHIHHLFGYKKRIKILKTAYSLGINYFDTARIYGHGIAEKSVGKFLQQENIDREKVFLSSKFGMNANCIYEKFPILMYFGKILKKIINFKEFKRNLSLEDIQKNFNTSLKNFNTDYIDFYYLHEPNLRDINELDNILPWLKEQKKNGKIRYLGLSGRYDECLKIKEKYEIFEILQVEYGSGTQREIKNADIIFGIFRNKNKINKKELISKCFENNQVLLFSTTKVQHLQEVIAMAKELNDL